MNQATSTVLIVLATALVVVLGVLAGFAISTLRELSATLRAARGTLETLTPKVDETLENLRVASRAAADGAAILSQLNAALAPLRAAGKARSLVGALFGGLAGLYTVIRRRRAARRHEDE